MKKKINLKRVVMEVFGGCNYTCKMCPQSDPGRGKSWTRKMPLTQFEKILDEVTQDFGSPQINLEGSGEPTMAKDLPKYIEAVNKLDEDKDHNTIWYDFVITLWLDIKSKIAEIDFTDKRRKMYV